MTPTKKKKSPLQKIKKALASPDSVVEALWRPSWFGAKDMAKEQLKSFLARRNIRQTLEFVSWYDFTEAELAEHHRFMREEHRRHAGPVRTVNWFVPYFHHAFYGGVYTLLRFADYFQSNGIENRILIYDKDDASPEEMRAKVAAAFPGLARAELIVLEAGQDPATYPPSDAAVATLWTSAYLVMKTRNTRAKYYFVQDYEPLFYPAGSMYALAEATYRFQLEGIVNTPGLCQIYQREFGAPATSFIPSVDRKVFHPPAAPRPASPFRVFFYGRPSVHRNAFEIGLSALSEFKQRHGAEVEVVSAGEQIPRSMLRAYPGLKTLGLLKFEATGDLYRTCHAGLALMMTKHPSYLPFELMACGAVVVANKNPANEWLLEHRKNSLVAEPVRSNIVEQLDALYQDRALLERLSQASLATVGAHDWESQLAKIHARVAGAPPAAAQRETS